MDSTGKKKDANVLDVWNNTTTCNLEEILLTNIKSSVYYKNLGAITKTYDKAVDEIYNEVRSTALFFFSAPSMQVLIFLYLCPIFNA